MYFSSELFVKRGPLGNLWLAGTVFHKLSKKIILSSNINELCKSIQSPPVPLALPARAQLFLGVCRIMDKKARYLLIDATEAQSKIQLAVTTSSVNLTSNRVQAKSDAINIICDFDDCALPPIPFDCLNEMADNSGSVPLFLEGIDDENVYLAGHDFVIANEADITLENNGDHDMNFVVPLDQSLMDPLDGGEDDMMFSINGYSSVGGLDEFLETDIGMKDDPSRKPVPSEAASTFALTLQSRKRTRRRAREDMKTEVEIDIIKKELSDTSAIVNPSRSCRTQTLGPLEIRNSKFMLSGMAAEMCHELQMLVEVNMEPAADIGRVEGDCEIDCIDNCHDDNPMPMTASVDDVDGQAYATDRDMSIERVRRNTLASVNEDEVEFGDKFLGYNVGYESPGHESLGSGFNGPHQRRMSVRSIGSIHSGSRRLSSVHQYGDDFLTPDLDLSLSQFDIPEIQVADSGKKFSRRESVDRATEILRDILEENFAIERAGKGDRFAGIDFHKAIQTTVGDKFIISRRDASLSFMQLLVLKTMDMVNIEQKEPYGPIQVSPTNLFSLTFSNSQFASL
uniref:Rad21/Rec8-like protein N-terminal domain-containing protein n=2 Tax=Spongospora subterranea TaxID=70186 RepID=A0A0H5R4J0_9EUKA|eukprot:CRZ08801.1 hypothetical protein [Spongospora subterranea]